MLVIDFLAATPSAWIAVATVLGLLLGSFLNVVIYRLPLIMQREWEEQCAALSGTQAPVAPAMTLSTPRSRCPHCGHAITALENVPVISYVFLRGRCRMCREQISVRYP